MTFLQQTTYSIVADNFHWTFPHYTIILTYTIIELLWVFHSIDHFHNTLQWP